MYQKELITRDIVLALNKTDTDPTGLAVSKIKDQMIGIKEGTIDVDLLDWTNTR